MCVRAQSNLHPKHKEISKTCQSNCWSKGTWGSHTLKTQQAPLLTDGTNTSGQRPFYGHSMFTSKQLKFPALHLTKGRWPLIHGGTVHVGQIKQNKKYRNQPSGGWKIFAHQAALPKRWFSDDWGRVEVTWARGFGNVLRCFGNPRKSHGITKTMHITSQKVAWHSCIIITAFSLCVSGSLGVLRPPVERPVVQSHQYLTLPANERSQHRLPNANLEIASLACHADDMQVFWTHSCIPYECYAIWTRYEKCHAKAFLAVTVLMLGHKHVKMSPNQGWEKQSKTRFTGSDML